MSKRRHSASPCPPSKVPHTSSIKDVSDRRRPVTFDTALYDELILVIFSYLSYTDLCAIQPINRKWARLALDNQLWKRLYLAEYGRTRLRRVRTLERGRDIKPLPGRAASKVVDDDNLDWKWLFTLGCNWRTGRCTVEQLDCPGDSQTHILLTGSLIITAQSSAPTVTILPPNSNSYTLRSHSIESTHAHITALALDQSTTSSQSRHLRISSFLSTGEFSICNIDHHLPSLSTRILTYVPLAKTDRTAPIVQAVYHHPIIITLSKTLKLSLYDLSDHGVRHVQTLNSFSSYSPASIVISQLGGTGNALKAVLVYTVPVYPAEWVIGVTELIISLGCGCPSVTSNRSVRPFDLPQGFVDETNLRLCREQWNRRVGKVVDTQTDGKWVVLASALSPLPHSSPESSPSSFRTATSFSNPLQLYRLSLPRLPSNSSQKLTFVRNLYGPTADLARIWVADGRCVSLGVDGSIWVWDLEEGHSSGSVWVGGTEVASSGSYAAALGPGKGTVVFDESRIVSAWNGKLEVRRFDV